MSDDLFIPVPSKEQQGLSDRDRAELGRRGAEFRRWRGDVRKIVYERVGDQPLRIGLEFRSAAFPVDVFFAQHLWVKAVAMNGHAWLMKVVGVSPQHKSILLEPREAMDIQTSSRWEQSRTTGLSEIQLQLTHTSARHTVVFALLN